MNQEDWYTLRQITTIVNAITNGAQVAVIEVADDGNEKIKIHAPFYYRLSIHRNGAIGFIVDQYNKSYNTDRYKFRVWVERSGWALLPFLKPRGAPTDTHEGYVVSRDLMQAYAQSVIYGEARQ